MEIVIVSLVIGIVIIFFLVKNKSKKISPPQAVEETKSTQIKSWEQVPTISWEQRVTSGLEKSRNSLWGKLAQLFSEADEKKEEIEEILYTADIPPKMVEELLEIVDKKSRGKSAQEILQVLYSYLSSKFSQSSLSNRLDGKPRIIMIVGVNGAGKTTTIGKLATKFKNEGKKVLVGACDTFRAAAVDQLQVWCERAGVEMLRAQDGSDPSGLAYDTVAKAYKDQVDICLIDTAGRLHNNKNLMEELTKTKRVMNKLSSDAPHEVWLVIDAISGQNAIKQAQEFHQALGLTGLIFTKCDGSAKAGSAIGIVDQLQIPIVYLGVGEQVEDLNLFDSDLYLKALLGIA